MSRDWEQQFRDWAKPPGQAEQDRCDNAVSAIKNAIAASPNLKNRSVSIFTQGSYRNNTNVRKDSDVDIGILCKDTFYHDPLPEGLTEEMLKFSTSTYQYDQYKNEVGEALVNYFGPSAVKRGKIAFNIRETNFHVEADVAAFFEHRRYNPNSTYIEGVELKTDDYRSIINWPEQHYENGVKKNNQTGKRFKSIVRILKSLSNEMTDSEIKDGNIPGFLIECLVWNVKNDNFQHSSFTGDVGAALAILFQNTKTDELCRKWVEVSELKYLFGNAQKWTRVQANAFTFAAWNYIGIWS